jgi:hypothetical protein
VARDHYPPESAERRYMGASIPRLAAVPELARPGRAPVQVS